MCFIVESDYQGQGRGSQLLRPVLRILDAERTPLYLETHKKINTEIYRHYGFRLVDTSRIPKTATLQYAMLQTPQKA